MAVCALARRWMLACASVTGFTGGKGRPKTNGCRDESLPAGGPLLLNRAHEKGAAAMTDHRP